MHKNFRNSRIFSPHLLTALVSALFFSVFLRVRLGSDDFFYASFFERGFFASLASHYENQNGKILVHALLSPALRLGMWPFRVIAAGSLGLTAFLVGDFVSRSDKKGRARAAALTLSLIALIGLNTLRESVFWAAGFFNYPLPALALLAAYRLFDSDSKAARLLAPAAFLLCGAMTEMVGALAVATPLFSALCSRGYIRRRLPRALLCSALAALGLLSILIAPSMEARLDEVQVSSLMSLARVSPVAALSFAHSAFDGTVFGFITHAYLRAVLAALLVLALAAYCV
ncbi:MAG: DUF6056 family protein, partial [Oscillospiraceae bacterium]|nr:DUF6056 family protein [Oscillospiraceae bacterium]